MKRVIKRVAALLQVALVPVAGFATFELGSADAVRVTQAAPRLAGVERREARRVARRTGRRVERRHERREERRESGTTPVATP